MASAPVQLDEESLIRAQIAQIDLPEGVRFRDIQPMIETTGEPAWRITFAVSKRIPLTKQRVRKISSMASSLEDQILDLKLGRWPFVRFIDSR